MYHRDAIYKWDGLDHQVVSTLPQIPSQSARLFCHGSQIYEEITIFQLCVLRVHSFESRHGLTTDCDIRGQKGRGGGVTHTLCHLLSHTGIL